MSEPVLTALDSPEEARGRRVIRKVAWRLLPFLGLLYVLNILDRTNAGFARLTMQDELGMSPQAFDLGYGIFYVGYLLFEVPANLLLQRFGARRWIARIMITWGLVSCATMAVTGPASFSLARLALGLAEAGFFPGIILYLTYWFPARERARMNAYFVMAIAVAGILGSPVSGAIMEYLDGRGGLKGWQWLFLLEGIPSVLLGIATLFFLTDRPEEAEWLEPEERDWLVARLRQEEKYRTGRHGADFLRALVDGRVWLLIALYFTVAVGTNAGGSYFPTILKGRFGTGSTFTIGLLLALINLCAVVAMVLVARSSDRTGERRGHVALAAALAAAGWTVAAVAPSPWVALAGLCLAQAGMLSMLPPFWTLPASFLSGAAAAGGIALINSVANFGGLAGPTILGQTGLGSMAVLLGLGSVLALLVKHDRGLERGGRQGAP